MCGIICIVHWHYKEKKFDLNQFIACLDKLRNRGPDLSNYVLIEKENYTIYLGFTRLSIMDISLNGKQPFKDQEDYVICNGEIYNYLDLAEKYKIKLNTNCDCEILLPLLKIFDVKELVNQLDAEFALISYKNNKIYASRDKYGVRPLYYGYNSTDNIIGFASELKALHNIMEYVEQVKPQFIYSLDLDNINLDNINSDNINSDNINSENNISNYITKEEYFNINNIIPINHDIILLKQNIRNLLINAVKKRLISDRPIGFLLSGGLDSSLIVAIATKILGPENITCFSIGIKNSPDILAAKTVVEYLNIKNHHIVDFTIENGLKVLPQVIECIETYDITTIRASVPQYLLAKYIKENTDIKVILSGEGSDELHGSYRYFYNASNANEFHQETKRLLTDLCYFDNLRTDRTMANHGLEVRVPFLDNEYTKYILSIDQNLLMFNKKNTMEKQLLRDCFIKLLPKSILYRRKEAFSDAVSSAENNWANSIKNMASELYLEQDVINNKYIINKPKTLDALYFRSIFSEIYPNRDSIVPYYWLPKWQNKDINDPSATVLDCY